MNAFFSYFIFRTVSTNLNVTKFTDSSENKQLKNCPILVCIYFSEVEIVFPSVYPLRPTDMRRAEVESHHHQQGAPEICLLENATD